MSKTLVRSGSNLRVGSTNYPATETHAVGSTGMQQNQLRFHASTKRLQLGTSSSQYLSYQGYDIGSTSNSNGSLWASKGTPGGYDRLYIAYGGRRYGFVPEVSLGTRNALRRTSRTGIGIGWGGWNSTSGSAVPSGYKFVVTQYTGRRTVNASQTGSQARYNIIRANNGGVVRLRETEANGQGFGKTSETFTIGTRSITSSQATNYVLNAGDVLNASVRIHGTGWVEAELIAYGYLIPASKSLPLVQ